MTNELNQAIKHIRTKTSSTPEIAVILGSGLGSYADTLKNGIKIETSSIPGYPRSTVEGHHGYLVFGEENSIPLLAVQGRTHAYEGYSLQRVTYVVRIMAELGIKYLIVTNAAGGINSRFHPGDLMLITDQINGFFHNPLRGPLLYGGPRFPDMSNPYSTDCHDAIEQLALKNGITLKRGVLYVSSGPSYESAAEVKMIAKAGGDAASMSTAPEVIVARQAGIKVVGISCITNMATGISTTPLDHDEVTETASLVNKKFLKLVTGIINHLFKSKQ
jgi:purine-nucleoside phosphorylase